MKDRIGWQNFAAEVGNNRQNIDLAKASLYYAQAEYPHLDIDYYLNRLDLMAQHIAANLPQERYPLQVIKTINHYLFDTLKFQGDREDYYNPENSYLNRVIDRYQGIPITLAVVYLEVAKRINFPMVGIGMPGHFIIRPDFEDAGIFVDVFNQGEILFAQDCEAKLSELYQQAVKLKPHFLNPVNKHQILARMLNNLKQIYLHQRQLDKVLELIEGILLLFPQNPYEIRDRGLLYYEMERWPEATHDLQIYLKILPDAEDSSMIQMLLNKISNF
jgi:regulator of sirC expression with transglutaminase-like and TPR domain